MNINIRKATLEDLSQLTIINGQGTEEGIRIAEERLPAFITSNNLIVAETDSIIIGLLYWKRDFFGDNNWFLTQVTVAPDYRRKGVGEKLWKNFLTLAEQNGARSAFCDISDDNTASKELALKVGGMVVGSIDLGNGDTRTFYRFETR
jgi:ribosomal protein S18 acetylase RimI-like enzyme